MRGAIRNERIGMIVVDEMGNHFIALIDEIGAGAYAISVFVAVRLRPPDLHQTILCSTVMNHSGFIAASVKCFR